MALTGVYLSLRRGVTGDEKKIQTLLWEERRNVFPSFTAVFEKLLNKT